MTEKPEFGLAEDESAYVLSTGGALVVKVLKRNGDITSLLYQGSELQWRGRGSHIGSGLITATVKAEVFHDQAILVTIDTGPDHRLYPGLTHYLAIRKGEDILYLATFPRIAPPIGELRWIARLDSSVLPVGPQPSRITGGQVIEGRDVFRLADGTTRSKFYGDLAGGGRRRAIDLVSCGVSGPTAAVWVVYDQPRESGSGGPFFRDIQHQQNEDQQLYNYMYSSHFTRDQPRIGVLHGPYAMVFTPGAAPGLPLDYSWMHELPIEGLVGPAHRGRLQGDVRGATAPGDYTVALSNAEAQYWAAVVNGAYAFPAAKPGSYALVVYRDELEVLQGEASIVAGASTRMDLEIPSPPPRRLVFAIGRRNGIPLEHSPDTVPFLTMHPSDVRMPALRPFEFRFGQDDPSGFPLLQLKHVNSPGRIVFPLPTGPVADLVFVVSITAAYKKARPRITINGHTLAAATPSDQPRTRCYSIGTYRGTNAQFEFTIDRSLLVQGDNTLEINVDSGWSSAEPFLNAGWIYDAVELFESSGPAVSP